MPSDTVHVGSQLAAIEWANIERRWFDNRSKRSFDDGSAYEDDTTMPNPQASSKAGWPESELQKALQSMTTPTSELSFYAVGLQQIRTIDQYPVHPPKGPQPRKSEGLDGCPDSRRDYGRCEHPPTANCYELPQRVGRKTLSQPLGWTITVLLAAGLVSIAIPKASAQPLMARAIISMIDAVISEADGTNTDQVSAQYRWVPMVYFFSLLAGCAWAVRVPYRNWTSKTCRGCLVVSGLLSLAVSIVWTGIVDTVDPNDNRRYLAVGFWAMLIIAFISEIYHGVHDTRKYAFLFVPTPTFFLVLHSTLFLADQIAVSEEAKIWTLGRAYKLVPLLFTLWTILSCFIFYGSAPVDDPNGGDGGNDPEGLSNTGGGGDAGIPLDNWPGSLGVQ